MPRRFFKSISPTRHSVINRRWLSPLRRWLDDPNLWAVRRRSIAPGVALGLFWGWLPLPGHFIGAALSAIGLRVNLPMATLMTWVANPLTILPMYYAGYRTGCWMLGTPLQPFSFELSLAWLAEELVALWMPMMLGCTLLGTLCAALGYLLVDLIWRSRIGDYLQRRRKRRKQSF
ncbi:MAG: DUF2062 domain-containing protein [Pseudomonadota bacterium]